MAAPAHSSATADPHGAHAHDAQHVRKDVIKYLLVFLALLVGTILTVGMYYVHIQSVATTIAIALFIATVKAALVAGFFMHLISERKAVYSILLATVFFFAAMMYLIVWNRADVPSNSNWWEGNVMKKEAPRSVIR